MACSTCPQESAVQLQEIADVETKEFRDDPFICRPPRGWQTLMVPLDVKSNPVMQGITWFASHFIGLFKAAADSFVDLATGVIPLLMVLITFMYALTTWIGEKRVTRAVQWAGRYAVTRYTIMPMLAVIMLTNPMCYTFGRFLPERYKPAYYDATVSFVHPVTSFFPTPMERSSSCGPASPPEC